MKYLSVCSGVEAATVAWHPLGWKPIAFAEIEKFPSQVLAHHYPEVPNMGDMTRFKEWQIERPDLIVGGTPCQSFSVAGLRKGLSDPRGNLALTFLAMVDHHRPEWVVWENVPGVLSSNGGRDFGSFLGGLAEVGYGFAYRVLDAQYFGVAQRRRRVFVIANARDWRRAAALLFEPDSLSGNLAPRRQAGEAVAPTIRAGAANGSAGHGARSGDSKDELIIPEIARCVTAGEGNRQDFETCTIIQTAHTLRGEGYDASEDGTGRGTPLIPVGVTIHGTHESVQKVASYDEVAQCLRSRTPGNVDNSSTTVVQSPISFGWQNSHQQGDSASEHVTPTLDKSKTPAVALAIRGREGVPQIEVGEDVANAILTPNGGRGGIGVGAMMQGMAVRRLTPRECERLQGFPDDYTLIPVGNRMAADGPRYKAMGNSMCVGVMRWLGERIAEVDAQ